MQSLDEMNVFKINKEKVRDDVGKVSKGAIVWIKIDKVFAESETDYGKSYAIHIIAPDEKATWRDLNSFKSTHHVGELYVGPIKMKSDYYFDVGISPTTGVRVGFNNDKDTGVRAENVKERDICDFQIMALE